MSGGGGDIWMRLIGFYTMAGLNKNLEIEILIPEFLRNLANHVFGDRLIILTDNKKCRYTYTSLGIRHLIKRVLQGERFISPYQLAVIHDRKKKKITDTINIVLFMILDKVGLVLVPNRRYIEFYQAFLEIKAIKQFKKTSYEQFKTQLKNDFNLIQSKFAKPFDKSLELFIPEDLNTSVVVFPNGTGRQFVPINWAKLNLPSAYYAFHYKDEYLTEFKKGGLKTISFFKPEDIIELSRNAKWTISTDSFPSHLLQSFTNNCSITITGTLRVRIISPQFNGYVVDSVANCHPCLHLDRNTHIRCSAGLIECINWKSAVYTENLVNSIPN